MVETVISGASADARGIDCIETRWHALPEVLTEMIGIIGQLHLRLSSVNRRL